MQRDLVGALTCGIEAAKRELVTLDRRAAALREWIEKTDHLVRALREEPLLGGMFPLPSPSPEHPPAPASPKLSLRQALRDIFAARSEDPISVADLMAQLRALGLEPKDDDSVDSTLYNLRGAGVPIVKVSPRTWRKARGDEAAPKKGGA